MAKRVRIQKKRQFRPHAEHFHAAQLFHRHGSEKVRGNYYQFVACLAFCAFALESYLNFIGAQCVKHWNEIERASPRAKLRFLMLKFGVHLEEDRAPMQTVRELFLFRNWLVHTRPEVIEEDYIELYTEKSEESVYASPLHKWEKFPSAVTSARVLRDVEALINLLNEKSCYPEPMPLATSSHSGGASLLDNESS